jgi:hypothetical protein
VFRVESLGSNRDPVFGRVSGKVVLRQVGPVVRRPFIAVEQCHASIESAPPQHLGGGGSRGTRADDHDGTRERGTIHHEGKAGRERIALDLLGDENHVATPLDPPPRDRVQRGSAQCLAGAQVEAGVMPRTANGVAVNYAFGEGPP